MKKNLIMLFLVFLVCSTVSMNEWTLMVYIAGDNDLDSVNFGSSYGSFFQQNVDLILSEKNEKVNIVIFYDRWSGQWEYGTQNSWRPVLRPENKKGTVVYTIKNEELIDISEEFGIKTGDIMDCGDAKNLEKFIIKSMELFPAKRFHLDLSSHGAGIDGINYDYSSRNNMSLGNKENNSLSEVIGKVYGNLSASILNKTGKKLDVISFDACLMGMLEVNYELSIHNVEYIVSSQQVIPGAGFPYDKMINGMHNKSNKTYVSNLTSDYSNLYYNMNGGQYGGFSLTSVEANKIQFDIALDKLGEVFDKLFIYFDKDLAPSSKGDIMKEFHNNIIMPIFKYPTKTRGNFIDIIGLLNKIAEDSRFNRVVGNDLLTETISEIRKLIVSNDVTYRSTSEFKNITNGMSIYFEPYKRTSTTSNANVLYENKLSNYSLSNTKYFNSISKFHKLYFDIMERN